MSNLGVSQDHCPSLRLAECFRLATLGGSSTTTQPWLASGLEMGETEVCVNVEGATARVIGIVLETPIDVVVSAHRHVPSLPFWFVVCPGCKASTRKVLLHPVTLALGCWRCLPLRKPAWTPGRLRRDTVEHMRAEALRSNPKWNRWARQRLIDLGMRPRLPLQGAPCYSDRGVEMPAITSEGRVQAEGITRKAIRLAAERGELYRIEAEIRGARLSDIDRGELMKFVQRTREHYPGADRKPKGGAPTPAVEASDDDAAPALPPEPPIPVLPPASAAEMVIEDPPEDTDETPPPEPRVVKRGGGVRRKA